MKRMLKYIAFACILISITAFVVQVDFKIVFQELSKVGFKFFLLIAITFVAYLLGTIGWRTCLGNDQQHLSISRLFVIRQVGEMVGLYNPSSVIGGDVLKNELLKPYGISADLASQSIIVSRVTAVLSQVLLLMLVVIWLIMNMADQFSSYGKIGLCFLLFALFIVQVLLFVWLNKKRVTVPLEGLPSERAMSRWIGALHRLTGQTRQFFQQQPIAFWLSYLFFALHWLVGSMEFYLILSFLNYDIALMKSLLLDMGVIAVKSLGAFVPGQIGVEELGNKLMLAAIGIQGVSIWLAVSVLRRTRQLFWILIGLVCYIFVRKTDTLKLLKHGNSVRQS